ncbi:MAG: 1,4-alpha-glucan branching protein GlgB [Verrucomicrobiota bacterium]
MRSNPKAIDMADYSLPKKALSRILNAAETAPHDILGMHAASSKGEKGVVVRAFLQNADSCQAVIVENSGEEVRFPLKKIDENGFFEGFSKDITEVTPYRLRTEQPNGEVRQFFDPYAFLPTLGEQDLYLFNEGNEHFIYNKLGAHVKIIEGVPGVSFAVWAPSARRVSVVGDFNQWDGRYHPMRALGSSGVWELFIPGLSEGTTYKFEVHGADEGLTLKTDPYGTRFEPPPHNASIVCETRGFKWTDHEWVNSRSDKNWRQEPISIYEVHPGSWKRVAEDGNRPLTYREMATELADYVKEEGFTHVEFLPLAEHPFSGSWGYQVTGFFAPTHRFGPPEDFQFLVNTFHEKGIGVIVDWVPGHFPKDSFGLARFDGSALYEHADPRQGEHRDWGTLIFNYGRHEVRAFLIASALSWFDRFHIDGLRVDAVASMLYLDYSREEGEWIPNQYGGRENIEAIEFLRQVNDLIHNYYPGAMTIAEESTAFGGVSQPTSDYGLGFDFKWNMGWMHDTLSYFSKDPIHRKYHQNELTFGMLYNYSEHFVLTFSHDEVVHGKQSMLLKMGMWHIPEKAANLRALYALMWAWPGKKTLFMGCEFGQSSEWRYDSSLDWHLLEYQDHYGIRDLVRDLNHLYQTDRTLAETDHKPEAFQWINCDDSANSVLSFVRLSDKEQGSYLVVGNFTPVERPGYRVGVPYPGFWQECLNSNASEYGGTGAGNNGGTHSEAIPWDGRPHSIGVNLPPLSVTYFRLN